MSSLTPMTMASSQFVGFAQRKRLFPVMGRKLMPIILPSGQRCHGMDFLSASLLILSSQGGSAKI